LLDLHYEQTKSPAVSLYSFVCQTISSHKLDFKVWLPQFIYLYLVGINTEIEFIIFIS